MFGLESTLEACAGQPRVLQGKQVLLLCNARCGMRVLTERLQPSKVWVPSYLCGPMLEGFKGTQVRFYGVNDSLQCRSRAWMDDIGDADIFFYIDYFGFPFDGDVIAAARARGAWIVEDACQALFSRFVGAESDFHLFSPRKFLGVPDGGILVASADGDMGGLDLVDPPAEWWDHALSASLQRREFDADGQSRDWFALYQQSESESPVGRYGMSELTRGLLERGGDRAEAAGRRRSNYQCLLDELGDMALFPVLPDSVVPLGFPVSVADRDRIRKELFAQDVYPPVHWDIGGCVPAEYEKSHQLSQTIMTLPCDQRYDADDMRRVASCIRKAMA